MKISKLLALGLLVIGLTPVFGQPVPAPADPSTRLYQQRLQEIINRGNRANPAQNEPPPLTKFNLDFRGGTPAQLVQAIEQAMGKPLNAIIPVEDADIQLPSLKMNDVVVPQLFTALEFASIKQVKIVTGSYFAPGGNQQESYSTFTSDYGFKTDGQPSDNSVWYFHADKPPLPSVVLPQKVCQFYPLLEYLNRGFTVDDITTAIQTGWKMAGETSPPELNYHKETKLLIAFGEPSKLQTIRNVLDSLPAQSSVQTRMNLADMQNEISQLGKQADQTQKKLNQLIEQLSTPVKTPAPSEEKSEK